MFVFEIPPGGSSSPQRHLYEEVDYVLEGSGSTQIELADGKKRSFEWGPRSLFAIPLNAKHRHFNASGRERALMVTTTDMPLIMNTFHNEKFIFDTDFEFADRTGKSEYFAGAVAELEVGVEDEFLVVEGVHPRALVVVTSSARSRPLALKWRCLALSGIANRLRGPLEAALLAVGGADLGAAAAFEHVMSVLVEVALGEQPPGGTSTRTCWRSRHGLSCGPRPWRGKERSAHKAIDAEVLGHRGASRSTQWMALEKTPSWSRSSVPHVQLFRRVGTARGTVHPPWAKS